MKDDIFSVKDLTRALNTKKGKVIKYQIDVSTAAPVSHEHIGIFRQVYRPKKGNTKKWSGIVYAYYFVKDRGSLHIVHEDVWYDHIVDFTHLLRLILDKKKTQGMIDNEDYSLNCKRQKIQIPEQVQEPVDSKEKIEDPPC